MSYVRSGIVSSVVLSLLLAWTSGATAAEDVSDTLKKVLERVEAQDKRIAEQDKKIAEQNKKIAQLEAQKKAGPVTSEAAEQARQEQIRQMIKDLQPEAKPNDLRLYWKEGIRMDSADKRFKLKFGGRLMNDWVWIGGSEVEDTLGLDLEDGTEFRRARLYVAGDIYEDLAFKLQFDFAGGDADLKDAYLRVKRLPVLGAVTIGHFKEPFGLEELTSSKYITFLERALPVVFIPSRNVGVMAGNTAFDKHMTWAVGMFRNTSDYGMAAFDGGYNVTARATFLPIYKDKGRKLLHLGGAYSFRSPEDTISYASDPEVHLAPDFVDTGSFDVERTHLFEAEAALVCGPFSAQAEYIASLNQESSLDDPSFYGFYSQLSYFLTGEHRAYKTSAGAFSRVKPKKNFRQDGGWGAWEIATRYSYLELNDELVAGGRLQNGTLGLNWYLNPNVRIMWNYIRSWLNASDREAADILTMRIQVDF